MTSSEETGTTENLDLERDIPLSEEDLIRLRNTGRQAMDLAAYLDYLEQIRAFETSREERPIFEAIFEL